MFKKPGPCKSTSQTRHCVSKYPFGELSWGMVREKTVCLRNQGHAKVPLRLAIVSVSIPLVSYPGVWFGLGSPSCQYVNSVKQVQDKPAAL